MDERKQRILQAIIQDYVKSAEPVASRTIARKYNLGVSPATVRNEMFDLEELGFLEQPHSSSGRVPSAKGYRYYVDTILHKEHINREDAELIRSLWESKSKDFSDFIQHTAKVISQVSHNMSMVLAPSRDTSIVRFLHVLPINDMRAIMVIITDRGALDNEPIQFDEPVAAEELERAALKLSNAVSNVPLRQIDEVYMGNVVQTIGTPRPILRTIGEAFLRALTKRKLFYAVGTPELLEQPEFKSIANVQPILNLLEEQEELSRLLTNSSNKSITIRIGTENVDEKIHNCSIIQAEFLSENEHIGTLAVLGPTRMEYGRLVGMLSYMQKFLETVHEQDRRNHKDK